MSADQWMAEAEKCLVRAEDCRSRNDWRGVYHQAGCAAEYALKAIYLKHRQLSTMPAEARSAKWHDLRHIATEAGLESRISRLVKYRRAYWLVVKDWDHQVRYPDSNITRKRAIELLTALKNPSNGIWIWLRNIYQEN